MKRNILIIGAGGVAHVAPISAHNQCLNQLRWIIMCHSRRPANYLTVQDVCFLILVSQVKISS